MFTGIEHVEHVGQKGEDQCALGGVMGGVRKPLFCTVISIRKRARAIYGWLGGRWILISSEDGVRSFAMQMLGYNESHANQCTW